MAGVVVENELGVDAIGGDADKADAKVVLPAAVGGGTGVKQDGAVEEFDLRDVAVPVDDTVDAAGAAAGGLSACRAASVTVDQGEVKAADGELKLAGEDRGELGIIVVADHGEHRGHPAEVAQNADGVDVPGVKDETDGEARE